MYRKGFPASSDGEEWRVAALFGANSLCTPSPISGPIVVVLSILLYPPILFLLLAAVVRGLVSLSDLLTSRQSSAQARPRSLAPSQT